MRLADAQAAVSAALAQGELAGAPPLAVVVLDAGGHPVAFARADGASLFRHDIARAKAMGALGMGADTGEFAERARANPVFFSSLSAVTGGALALSAGGIVVRDAELVPIGSVGVSGGSPEIDQQCAAAGAAACVREKM